MKTRESLPLCGVRVVDFGQQIAAPAVAMVLADLGATVVHVDPPTGPQWQHPANAVLNRNKQCTQLDLKSEQGLAQAHELIANADIVIESFRPGVIQRLGIDFSELRAQRPELITLSLPGFASDDQLRRDWKATEAVVAATCGAFTDMGFNRVLMGVNPSFSPLPLGSAYAISLASASLALALYARQSTGRGDHIEVPVAAALMEGLSYNSYVIEDLPNRYKTMREHEIEYRRANGIEMDLSYEDLQEYLDPFYRTYECADGRFFYCVCPSHRNHARRALVALGIYEKLIGMGLPEVEDVHLPSDEWSGETSIGVYPLPKKWADIISAEMKVAFKQKTSDEWGRIFGETGIPGAPHRTTQEWVNDEHTNEAGLIVQVPDTEFGTMRQPGPMAWFEGQTRESIQPTAAQQVSVEQAIAALAGVQAPELPAPSDQPNDAWLKGIKVLDLTNVIAGPHSAAFLARFGAEIIKMDPVKPLYDPLIGTLFTFQTGVGKRSALVDITTVPGREILDQMIRDADIVVINAPERQIKPLGLDEATLKSINPEVIFCRLDCLGGPLPGPKTHYIGYDDIIQANSGIMSRFGGPATPEEHAHLGTLDVNCGFAAGFGMGVALYHLARTGETLRARTSLSAVTNIAQLPFAFDYEGRAPFNEPSGREALGHHAFSHFYETAEGWLYLDSHEGERQQLAQVPGLEGIQTAAEPADFLREAFKIRPADEWLAVLRQADIAAAEPMAIETLRELYTREADQTVGGGSFAFSHYSDHPSGHGITMIDQYAIRPTEAPLFAATPTERFGHSTVTLLLEMGYGQAQIDAWVEQGVVGLGWGKEFLPSDSLSASREQTA